jgi:signal transduction histidine kinase
LSPKLAGPAPRHSLSVRLLVLVVSVLLLVETLIFVFGLQRERWHWLHERLNAAQLVVLAVGSANGGMPPSDVRAQLERLSDAEMIVVSGVGGTHVVLPPVGARMPAVVVMLDQEDWLRGFVGAAAGLGPPRQRRLELIGTSRMGTTLDLLVPEYKLSRFLRDYALRFAVVSVLIAGSTGGLLFLALRAMLVVPLGRIAHNIARFRADPERGVPLDAERVSVLRDDEITLVGRELSGMQAELRTALWRNARLAAVGTAVSKMSHDLRGILSSSLLVADRLTMSQDEQVRGAGEVIVRAVHRATALAQQTLDFVREGPPALVRTRTKLRGLIDEAGAAACEQGRCAVDNRIDPLAEANIDRDSMLRVLTNLFRNAAQAGARRLTVTSTGEAAGLVLTVADDGPGLPEAVRQHLFRPFVSTYRSGGTGLGLAIARDLMRAHGGDLQLAATGPAGTSFVLYLQQPRAAED